MGWNKTDVRKVLEFKHDTFGKGPHAVRDA